MASKVTTTSASNSASFKWVKQVTEIGLTFMREKAREERLNSVMPDNNIDCEALAALIDECAAASGVYLGSHEDRISASDAEVIRTQLGRISGAEAVANANPNELAAWVMELKASI